MPRSILLSIFAVFLFACDGGGTGAAGIYEIASWTENPDSCDSEGASVAENNSDTFLYVENAEFFGQEFVNVGMCPDLEACRSEASDDTINLGGFAFEDGSDSKGWSSTGYFIGGDTCSGETYADTLLITDEGVTIERRATDVDGVPKDSDGFCDGDAAVEMAKSLPCSRLEVLKAELQEDL
tara:strand:+ start:121293 stop:121838 length:546 start_codon:yes stop_codon:yes gene_type:complete